MRSPSKSPIPGPEVAGSRPRAAAAFQRLEQRMVDHSDAPRKSTRYEWTLVQMQGLGIRKALKRLFHYRKQRGQRLGTPGAWGHVAADIAAAIKGHNISGRDVEGVCTVVGFSLDRVVYDQLAVRASHARKSAGTDDLNILAAAAVGYLIELTAEERSALKITRIDAIDETAAQRKRRLERERKAAARAAAGAVPRSQSKNVLAPWKVLGISRSTYYARGLHRVRTESSVSPYKGETGRNSPIAGKTGRNRPDKPAPNRGKSLPRGKPDETVQCRHHLNDIPDGIVAWARPHRPAGSRHR